MISLIGEVRDQLWTQVRTLVIEKVDTQIRIRLFNIDIRQIKVYDKVYRDINHSYKVIINYVN